MKTKLLSIILFFVSFSAFADVPQAISYQAVARNASGEVITGKKVSIRVNLLQGSVSGINVYSETHTPVSNQSGVVTLQIGMGNASIGTFPGINWANGPYFVKMEMDVNGGDQYKEIGISQLLAVPYALYAESTGENVENSDYIVSVDHGGTEDILYNGELIADEHLEKGGYLVSVNTIYQNSKNQEVDCNLIGLPESITFKKTASKSTNYGRHFVFVLTSDIDHTTEASYNCKLAFYSKSGITKEFPFDLKILKKKNTDSEEVYKQCIDSCTNFIHGIESLFHNNYMKYSSPLELALKDIADKTMHPDNEYVAWLFYCGMSTINILNQYIAQYDSPNYRLAEMRYKRAVIMLHFCMWFNKIPLFLSYPAPENLSLAPKTEIANFIISEMNDISRILPEKLGEEDKFAITINDAAALSILSYLLIPDWEKAKNNTQELISRGSRLDDIIYFYNAIACWKVGNTNNAIELLNFICINRGQATPYTSATTITEKLLYDHYKKYVRTSYINDASIQDFIILGMLEHNAEYFNVDAWKTILPIPTQAIMNNPGFIQNPGY